MTRPTPVFRAVEVSGFKGSSDHIALWCPWCETVHRHGAAGGGGGRGAHCTDRAVSPLSQTGYRLDVVGSAASEKAVTPDGLMVGERRLNNALAEAAPDLRRLAIRHILGLARASRDVVTKRVGKGAVWIFGASRWLIERSDRPPVEGEGLLRLSSELYGVSPGVAAVRLLEAASAERFDAEAAFAIQQAVDDWTARGAPKRGARA